MSTSTSYLILHKCCMCVCVRDKSNKNNKTNNFVITENVNFTVQNTLWSSIMMKNNLILLFLNLFFTYLSLFSNFAKIFEKKNIIEMENDEKSYKAKWRRTCTHTRIFHFLITYMIRWDSDDTTGTMKMNEKRKTNNYVSSNTKATTNGMKWKSLEI